MSSTAANLKKRKWRVVVVHSAAVASSSGKSWQSLYNSLYLALCLQCNNTATVTLVSDVRYAGNTSDLPYVPPPGLGSQYLKSNDAFDSLELANILEAKPDLIIFVLNPGDMAHYAGLLAASLSSLGDGNKSSKVLILNLMRSVQEDFALSDKLADFKNAVIVNGILGFDVVKDPTTEALTPLTPRSGITLERLNRDNVKAMDPPARLLESTGINVLYRKGLSSYSWGLCIYEQLLTLNTLLGGSVRGMLQSGSNRRIAAAVVHETLTCLRAAGRRSDWKPSLFCVSYLTPEHFVAALLAPSLLFWLLVYASAFPIPTAPSVGQAEIAKKQEPVCKWNLQQIVATGDKYNVPVSLCKEMLKELERLEKSAAYVPVSEETRSLWLKMLPANQTFYNATVPRAVQGYLRRAGLAFIVLLLAVIIPVTQIFK